MTDNCFNFISVELQTLPISNHIMLSPISVFSERKLHFQPPLWITQNLNYSVYSPDSLPNPLTIPCHPLCDLSSSVSPYMLSVSYNAPSSMLLFPSPHGHLSSLTRSLLEQTHASHSSCSGIWEIILCPSALQVLNTESVSMFGCFHF